MSHPISSTVSARMRGETSYSGCEWTQIVRADRCSDTGSFGSLQALPSWLRSFGTYNEATGKYAIKTYQASVMNSGE